ncbi:hypothetical protein Bca4012_010484 [Brassica carinata]|uniref:Uncharacterized protein n=1 Tax=Brassica carinata TaxID=52824 RepID=A0A8X7S3C1_BRACI|nr:hypothetical protein Bca52824_035404 [Brassica carinata]
MSGATQDIYMMGKTEATECYRAILRMVKTHDEKTEKKHQVEVEKYSISDQIKFLDGIMQKGVSYFNIKEEKNRIEAELLLAEEKLSTIKGPHVDWYRIGESWMAKP